MQPSWKARLATAVLMLGVLSAPVPSQVLPRTEVAEGRYDMKARNIGAGSGGTFGLSESWKLWRLSDSNYMVEGKWKLELDSDVNAPRGFSYEINMSPDFHTTAFRISGAIPGTPRVGTFDCELAPGEFRCRIEGQGAQQGKELKLSVEGPYDLFIPTPWFLTSLVGRARREIGKQTPVRLVFLEDGGAMAFEGRVDYLGEAEFRAAGQTFQAEKFEIHPGALPWSAVVWLSPEGMLLAFEDSKNPGQRMELTKYKKHADFGPGR